MEIFTRLTKAFFMFLTMPFPSPVVLLFTPFTATHFAANCLLVKLRGIWSVNSNLVVSLESCLFCLVLPCKIFLQALLHRQASISWQALKILCTTKIQLKRAGSPLTPTRMATAVPLFAVTWDTRHARIISV